MTVSLEDAVRLLRKWAMDKTPVSVVILTGCMSVSFSGFIATILSDALAIEHHSSAGKAAELIVGLAMADRLDYSGVREAPPAIMDSVAKKFASMLTICSDGAQCVISERIGS